MKIKRDCNSHWRGITFENSLIKVKIRVFAKSPIFDNPICNEEIREIIQFYLTPEQYLYYFGKDI